MKKIMFALVCILIIGSFSTMAAAQVVCGSIGGYKYHDVNTNNQLDEADAPIPCWVIELYMIDEFGMEVFIGSTRTDANGAYIFPNLPEGYYIVREVLPAGNWLQTAPQNISSDIDPQNNVVVVAVNGAYVIQLAAVNCVVPSTTCINFGNVRLVDPCNGFTLGLWSNKNGSKILSENDPAWRNLLNSLYLVKADGSPYDVPAGDFQAAHKNFRSWILGANGKNMSYMLSAQLAATILDAGFVIRDSLALNNVAREAVRTYAVGGTLDINDLATQFGVSDPDGVEDKADHSTPVPSGQNVSVNLEYTHTSVIYGTAIPLKANLVMRRE